jgi:hypothetical protein
MATESGKSKSKLSWLESEIFGITLPWYWKPIALIVLLVTLHLMIKLHIKDTTYQFLDGFAWLGEGEFRNSDYSFGGRFESTDLTITPDDSDQGSVIRIPRISVQSPGFFWLLRTQIPSFNLGWSLFGGKPKLRADQENRYPPTDKLDITFERVDWGALGMEDVLPDVSWVGPYSGAAFEAAGCSKDWWWHRDEFVAKFKLAEPSGDIRLQFRTEDDQILHQTLEFGSAETSHALIERRFALPEADDFLDTHPDDFKTLDVRWTFRDHGFNKARNRYCADQAGISEAEFIERHIAAVERIMASKGLVFPRGVWLAYRRYAEGGKEMIWQTNYGEGVAWEDISSKRGAALFTAMNASLQIEGFPRIPYQPEIIEPRPLPEEGDYASVFAIVQKEGGAPLPVTDPALPPLVAPAQLPDTTATPQPAIATEPAQVDVARASTSIVKAAPESPTEPEPIIAGSEIPSRTLGKYIGEYVRIELSTGRSYIGAVAKSDAVSVTLKVKMRSGQASLSFPHKQIRRVTRI